MLNGSASTVAPNGSASTLLAKFQQLQSQRKDLQAENGKLREELSLAKASKNLSSSRSLTFSDDAKSSAIDKGTDVKIRRDRRIPTVDRRMPSALSEVLKEDSLGFEKFLQRLTSMGLTFDAEKDKEDLEDLFVNVQRQEIRISNMGVHLLQEYSVVKVYLLANIGGAELCLIEHDRFDLLSGRQKTLMVPLTIRMHKGEKWTEAARRGLQSMVGLSQSFIDQFISIDESSHFNSIERSSASSPCASVLDVSIHEVHARLNGHGRKSHNHQAFKQLGLPSGRDFVQIEVPSVHVWCWKSREYENSGRMKEFEKHLSANGVDTELFGTNDNKTLFQFYREVKEQKTCSLLEIPAAQQSKDLARPSTPQLLRVVQILQIKLVATVHKWKRVLMESEQYTNARKRFAGQFLVKKLREDQDWRTEVSKVIHERLGISPEIQEECFSVDTTQTVYSERAVPSQGLAGIMSNYRIRCVSVHVLKPDHAELLSIGLPRGNDFISKEYNSSSDQLDLHVWTWAPVPIEEEDSTNKFHGTALEELSRDLIDVKEILGQTAEDPQFLDMGLGKPFKTALQKINTCVEKLSDIDKTVKNVDVSGIMYNREMEHRGSRTSKAMFGLKKFIEANFVATAQLEADQFPKVSFKRHHSRILAGNAGLSVCRLDSFSLESLFSNSCRTVRTIMERRNDWNYDFFNLATQCENNTSMLESYGEVIVVPFAVRVFKADEIAAIGFVHTAASLYRNNPYHGPIHAAQVCHLSRWLSKATRIMEHQSELESLSFMIAAICHDIKHPGRSNTFCVQTESPLALLYNNVAVLERYHSASCLQLLDSSKLMANVPREERQLVRSHIIEYILATDMAEHFEFISKFRVRRESPDFSIEVETDRRFVARLCLKLGDLGHGCLPWHLHLEWSSLVCQEFYAQGDDEKKLGLPVSALCDRDEVGNLAKSQKGFLEFVVAPLCQAIVECQEYALELTRESSQEEVQEHGMSEPPEKGRTFTDESTASQVKEVQAPSCASPTRRGCRASIKRYSTQSHEAHSFNVQHVCVDHLNENSQRWQVETVAIDELKAKLPPAPIISYPSEAA